MLSQEICEELACNAKRIAHAGKGILAADESTGTIGKRFNVINIENTENNRANYRELLFTTPNLGNYISGVILYEETLNQTGPKSNKKMTELLDQQGIIPGIKVDKGVVNISQTNDEKSTSGLDGLYERCGEYYKKGCRFAKWRAVLSIDKEKCKPSDLSILETAHSLCRYASICQSQRLVPIIEPEILTDGDHDVEYCALITEKVLAAVFEMCSAHKILLEGSLLKPNMVTAGSQCCKQASAEDVAFYTVRTLRRTVPSALPGIMFLSGGQSEEQASMNLNAMNKYKDLPWIVSFSYGRALQASVIKSWQGKLENTQVAQNTLIERAKANSDAQLGQYKGGAGGSSADTSLYEKKYVY